MSTLKQPADAVAEAAEVPSNQHGTLDPITPSDYILGSKLVSIHSQPPEVQIAILKAMLAEFSKAELFFTPLYNFHGRFSPPTLSYLQHPDMTEVSHNDRVVYLDLDRHGVSALGVMSSLTRDLCIVRDFYIREDGALILREIRSEVCGVVVRNDCPRSVTYRHMLDSDFSLIVELGAVTKFLVALSLLCESQIQELRRRERHLMAKKQKVDGVRRRIGYSD